MYKQAITATHLSPNGSAKRKGIRLTDRDQLIIQFINQFGFCELAHLQRKFTMDKKRCYKVIKRLLNAELLQHQFIFHQRPGVYQVTTAGAHFSDLPPLVKVPLTIYDHQLMTIHVALELLHLYPGSQWLSERQLIKEKYFLGFGVKGHVADGILLMPDGKSIAIEVELTLKSKNRLLRLFKSYSTFFDIKEVWYIAPTHIRRLLEPHLSKYAFIKLMPTEAIHVKERE